MFTLSQTSREVRIGLGLLLLAGLFLGIRAQRTVSTVLGTGIQAGAASTVSTRAQRSKLSLWASRDSLVAGSSLGARDPFRDPPAPSEPRPAVRPNGSSFPETPALRAVLFDAVRPSVQLSASGETSEWLQRGDVFRGWRIDEIRPASVTISKGGQSAVLTSS